jgi:hypothetical protein
MVLPTVAPAVPGALAMPAERNRIGIMVSFLGLYLFLHVVPGAEITAVFLHIPFSIVALMCVALTVMAAFTMRLGRFFQSPVALPWVVVLVLMLVASACGLHPSHSLAFVLTYAARLHMMPLLICAIAMTTRHVRHLLVWMASSQLLALFICWRRGVITDGRFAVPEIEYQNPNDLALYLLFGVCFVVFVFFYRSFGAKLLMLATVTVTIMYVAKTGSRAALLCLLVMVIALIIYAPGRVRLALVVATPVLVSLLSLAVPQGTWARLSKITFDPEADYGKTADEAVRQAIDSQMARINLQKRAIEITKKHPLLGVGPLMFADAADNLSRLETGRKGSWQSTHNVYLEMASEAGIPACLFFIGSIFICVKLNYRAIKSCRGADEYRLLRAQSFCLLLATLAYATGITFCNFTFGPHLSMLVGLSAANALAISKEVQARAAEGLVQTAPAPGYGAVAY